MKPKLLRTAGIMSAFLAVTALFGFGAYLWAESIDPLAGLEFWVLRAILFCFIVALVPWSLMVVMAIVGGHMEMMKRYAETRHR